MLWLVSTAALVTITTLSLLTLRNFHYEDDSDIVPPKPSQRVRNSGATKDSEASCSAATPKAVMNAGVAAGLSIAMYEVLAMNTGHSEHFQVNALLVVLWALMSAQAFILSLEPGFQKRYMHGIRLSCSAAISLQCILYRQVFMHDGRPDVIWPRVGSLSAVFLAGLSIPRQPSVLHQGLQVDRESSVSFWRRLTFSWGPFHASGSVIPENMKMADLPEVGHASRVTTLKKIWTPAGAGKPVHLWRQLMRAFFPTLVTQWLLVFISSASQFSSRFALYRLLQCLENQGKPPSSAPFWVAGLGIGLLFETLSNSWLIWFTQMRLQIPIEGLLKSLIVEKLTRRPLAAGERRLHKRGGKGVNATQFDYSSLTDILSNHCRETASACAHMHRFLVVIFKLLIDVQYLARLLGAKSILAGAVVSMLLVPVSTRLSRRYRAERSKSTKAHSAVSKLVSEALQGLRHIRLSSMEGVWQARLGTVRDRELEQMWRTGIAMSQFSLAINLGPVLLISVALSMYAYETGHLSSSLAFLGLNLFDSIHAVFQELPSRFAEARVSWSSCELLHRYLSEPEREKIAVSSDRLSLENAVLGWQQANFKQNLQDDFTLSSVSVAFPPKSLSIVTGSTGSGKSLFLSALLGEANLRAGQLLHPLSCPASTKEELSIIGGSTAFVSQPPWIENSSILDNILFGNFYDEARYKAVLDACALNQDISVLPSGDQTIAGLNGAFLSGGQKWRVALARAFYSTAEILILDDVLTAVDAQVAKNICSRGIMGELARGRTIIMATHKPDGSLTTAKYHVTIENGRVEARALSDTAWDIKTLGQALPQDPLFESAPNLGKEPEKPEHPKKKSATLAAMSTRQILSAYMWASGGVHCLVVAALVTLLSRAVTHSSSWWLTQWTVQDKSGTDYSVTYNVAIYFALSLATVIALEVKSLVLLTMSIGASRSLFQKLVQSVLYAPLSWIDSMPLGEMIQVLETDIYTMDNKTTQSLHNLLGNLMNLVIILISSFLSAPQTIFFSAVVLFIYSHVAMRQLAISRQLFKLIDQSLRPVLEQATSISSGLATIRAFNRTDFYIDRMHQLIDRSAKLGLHLILGQRWLAVRLGALGAVFVTIVAATLVYAGESAAKTGLIITLALQLKAALSGATTMFNLQDMLANTIGRIVSLAHVEIENQDGNEPPRSWHADASIKVCNLVVGYDPSTRPAIRAVNFSVAPGQRLGIVGRTGSGKTSLMNALARFINPSEGQILINGVDISTVKIKRLRETIMLIPQDPFLFLGTLRSNVDPSGTAADDRVLDVLRRVNLIPPSADDHHDTIPGTFADLEMDIQARGVNISYGQRQLICLARALLIKCPILVLDEATSGVDDATDTAVQRVIRQEFSHATILVVAHRILTVADFDRILVMSDGEVAEFGPPAALLARRDMFWNMVQHSGDVERIMLAIQNG